MTTKISDVIDGDYLPVAYGRVFARERVGNVERLRIGYDDAPDGCVQALASTLSGPYHLLYVLHTSRTGAELGRYQSPELSGRELDEFFREFGRYIAEDGRHDLWVLSSGERATLVVDRHNVIFAYGPLDLFEQRLEAIGAVAGDAPRELGIHAHHYHAEWDESERAVLAHYDWEVYELLPSDVQYVAGEGSG